MSRMKSSNRFAMEIEKIQEEISELRASRQRVKSPEELESLEQEIRDLTNRLGNALLGEQVQDSLDSDEMGDEERELVKQHPKRMKNEGKRYVNVQTSFGETLSLEVRYYRRNCDSRKGKRHKGMYAGLALLGIFERCSPLLTSELGMLTATLGSFQETQHILKERGCELNPKTLQRIAYRFAERVRQVQRTGDFGFSTDDSLAGRRVVVSTDGGRLRLREKKRGPKTAKGRNRYKAAWREPKLFIIYVVDEKGQQHKSFAPLIDGLMSRPDTMFALLQHYLTKLDIQEADQLLFVSDGATWIWNRIPELIEQVGIDKQRVHLLIDFFHAVQHLHRVATLRKDWSPRTRKQWTNKQTKLLANGNVSQVIDNILPLCRGRNSRSIKTQLAYFVKHQEHMAYKNVKELHLPIGSGAIESAIRRVVNLRLKGTTTYWKREHADALLLLRSAYKAGRWTLFKSLALSPTNASL